ncbi:MAG TPA: circadian clock KaiB family protein [Candidatus Tectomicrobia bacterium]|jgi:circadian clock protein KaiB
MELPQHNHAQKAFEAALAESAQAAYVFRLYVAGATPRSTRAVYNLAKVCQERLAGHYELEVIDIYQQPARVQADQIVAVPTLCKELPLPAKRLIGDLSNERELMAGLGLSYE